MNVQMNKQKNEKPEYVGTIVAYGSCPENKKEGVGFKFLSYRVFRGYEGGYEGVRDRFAVGGRSD